MERIAFHFPINARPRTRADKKANKPDANRVQVRRRIEDIEEARRFNQLFAF
ncbi:hypothetical protein [Aliivibrio fischeri]|uniref:hypothetical protein n=1 Tax=Aliivibrio fischeri TaxID=668 RepID=UPI00159EE754|nr:hypothetical protein [Aliivibrio fischeri]